MSTGDLWIVSCAFAFAFYVLQVGKYSKEENPIPSVIVLMLFCALGSFAFSLFDSNTVWFPSTDGFWTGILFAGIPATAYMYTVQNIGQRYMGEEKVALTYLFEPVFATIAGVLILNEEFTKEIFIGGFLILTAMFIAEVDVKKFQKCKT